MGVALNVARETRCPVCDAEPGAGCTTISYSVVVPRARLHHERIQEAGRVSQEMRAPTAKMNEACDDGGGEDG